MSEYVHLLLQNEILSGLMGGSVFASILYGLRRVPSRLWEAFLWKFTTELTVFSSDSSFQAVDEWLSNKLSRNRRTPRIRLTSKWSEVTERREYIPTFGEGWHWLWHNRQLILVSRTVAKETSVGGHRNETLVLTTLGTSTKTMLQLTDVIIEAQCGGHSDYVPVYTWKSYYWKLSSRKFKRPLDTVVLNSGDKQALLEDVETFISSRDWYRAHGVPYRRGYLLEGPPGGGKTSLVLALASQLSKRIYILNFGSLKDDNDLIGAMSTVPEDAILLIEDIDATQQDRDRAEEDRVATVAGDNIKKETKKETPSKITLSTILNVIDGIMSTEGRILVMTTNHPEKLDAALLRDGRIDLTLHLGDLDMGGIVQMCDRFDVGIPDGVKPPISASTLQGAILAERSKGGT